VPPSPFGPHKLEFLETKHLKKFLSPLNQNLVDYGTKIYQIKRVKSKKEFLLEARARTRPSAAAAFISSLEQTAEAENNNFQRAGL